MAMISCNSTLSACLTSAQTRSSQTTFRPQCSINRAVKSTQRHIQGPSTWASPRISRTGSANGRSRCSVVVHAGLKAGSSLPELGSLEADDNSTVSLNSVAQDSNVLIFIYPRADTSGCTKQACGFNDNLSKFTEAGYKIFGLSADAPADQAAWKEKFGYKYNLLSDPSHKALQALGVSDGRLINRSHFLISKGGVVKDARIGISSGDSVPEALKVVTGKESAPAAPKKSFGDV